jgi:hypothetical protein
MVTTDSKTYKQNSGMFFKAKNTAGEDLYTAHGRDPYFPSWIDTAQVNAFSPTYRQAALDTLLDIATQCDGVRCDMAMLMVNRIFEQTWGKFVTETIPETEYWEEIIPQVKSNQPNFLFIAEVYWDMEYELQQQGFDFTYDKTLYDRLLEGDAELLRKHLVAERDYQEKIVRFIENHDEPRAATSMGTEKSRAAATLITTLPGAVLLHDGQFTGRTVKLPVQINRQPDEIPNYALSTFYWRLLNEVCDPIYQRGEWRLEEVTRVYLDGVDMHGCILAHSWRDGESLRLIVVNITWRWAQGSIPLEHWSDILNHNDYRLYNFLSTAAYYRDGRDLAENGLYVELEPFEARILDFIPLDHTHDADYIRRATSCSEQHDLSSPS